MFTECYKNRRVLVTGHTGFKGSWLSQWLILLGANVSGISLPLQEGPSLFRCLGLGAKMTNHFMDIRDEQSLIKVIADEAPEYLFHMAAQPLVRRSYESPKETFDINVGGTVNLMEAIRHCRSIRSAVIITSDKCYENKEWTWGYREIDPLGGHDPYSASKAAVELVASSYRNSFFLSSGPRLATARAGNVLGGGDWAPDRILPDFIASVTKSKPLQLRNPHATRPWQHVLEPLSGYLQLGALLSGSNGNDYAAAWNFGPDHDSTISVQTLVQLLSAAWAKTDMRVVSDLRDHPHEAASLSLDCSKARSRLRWKPVWSIRDAVKHSIDWFHAYEKQFDLIAVTDQQIAAYCQEALHLECGWTDSTPNPSSSPGNA